MNFKYLLPLFLLFSQQVFALHNWRDLETGFNYKLTQGFELSQLERSRSKLTISKGDRFELREVSDLSAIKVILFKFLYKNCPGVAMKTDMEIIPVQGTSPVVEIGAQLEEMCEFNIYIETKDLMTKSFFN